MSKLTMGFGAALIILGVAGYLATGGVAVTALIPAFFGMPILALGGAALVNEDFRKHAMHATSALALLGFLGTAPALRFGLYMLSVGPRHVERPTAVALQCVMAILCGVYLYFSVRSFIAARRKRAEQ
jgi:hypothetical protein